MNEIYLFSCDKPRNSKSIQWAHRPFAFETLEMDAGRRKLFFVFITLENCKDLRPKTVLIHELNKDADISLCATANQ